MRNVIFYSYTDGMKKFFRLFYLYVDLKFIRLEAIG